MLTRLVLLACFDKWSIIFLRILRKCTFLLTTLFCTNISTFDLLISISNSYSDLKEVHVSLRIIVAMPLDTTFHRISSHFTKTEWIIHSSSNNNWHKLPSLLFDKLYQKMENYKLELTWLAKQKKPVFLYRYTDHQR